MKKIILILCACLLLTGCGEATESKDTEDTNMFIYIQSVKSNGCYDVVYHRDTKVMYTISRGAYNQGNFTLLVNADGTPMVYEESEE